MKGLKKEDNEQLKDMLQKVNEKVKIKFEMDVPFLHEKFLKINKNNLLYKKIELFPTDQLTDEDIKTFEISHKDLKNLIEFARSKELMKLNKTSLILKVILILFNYRSSKK